MVKILKPLCLMPLIKSSMATTNPLLLLDLEKISCLVDFFTCWDSSSITTPQNYILFGSLVKRHCFFIFQAQN